MAESKKVGERSVVAKASWSYFPGATRFIPDLVSGARFEGGRIRFRTGKDEAGWRDGHRSAFRMMSCPCHSSYGASRRVAFTSKLPISRRPDSISRAGRLIVENRREPSSTNRKIRRRKRDERVSTPVGLFGRKPKVPAECYTSVWALFRRGQSGRPKARRNTILDPSLFGDKERPAPDDLVMPKRTTCSESHGGAKGDSSSA